MLILDTDVLIDVQRGHAAALVWFAGLTDLPSVPGLVVMELIQGAQDARQVREALRLTAPLPVVWPTTADCRLRRDGSCGDIIPAKGGSVMASIVMQSRSGPDRILHLEVPVSEANTEFEVEVVVRPKGNSRVFPPGYFDLIGSVDDDTLTIWPQPPLPPPVEFE